MGKSLSFASYAKCLQKAMKSPYDKQLKLAELLLEFLIMPDEEHEEYYAYAKKEQLIFMDKVMASNLFNGKENVHKNIQKNCDLDFVVNGIEGYFKEKILPFVSLHLKDDMMEEMAEIINGDTSIAKAKKKEFAKKAEENDSSGFLSSVFLYAVKKENTLSKEDINDCTGSSNANVQYYNNYVENLFLHTGEGSKTVRLKDLFVMPMYKEVAFGKVTGKCGHVVHYISEFAACIANDARYQEDFLFVEGDAGAGKTSLVSHLSYLYIEKPEEWKRLFGSKVLLCIRLRDIIPIGMKFSSDTIVQDILNYLKLKSMDEFRKLYKDALIIMDGFDELCMVEGINENSQYYIYQIYEAFKGYKVLVTTRPQYLYVDGLNFKTRHIVLQHFDTAQREKWLNNYRATGILDYEEYGIEYISDEENEEIDSICSTPMVMYMIVAGGINEKAKHNKWALYHQIFYKELSDTEYNSMFANSTGVYSHGIKKHKDLLYRLSAEIAYKMFQSGNTKLFVTEQEILDIVRELKIEDIKLKEVAQHCYALCNYWKSNGKGEVEFYHNNIRDFFLCEKIFYEFNSIYQICKTLNMQEKVAYINAGIYSLLRYMKLPQRVVEFLYWRAKYNYESYNTKDFPAEECENKYLQYFFSDMLQYGGVSHYDRNSGENIYNNMVNVLSNTVQIYRCILEPYLAEEEHILWFNDPVKINREGIMRCNFENVFMLNPVILNDKRIGLPSRANFKEISLRAKNLTYVDFTGSDLTDADLSDSIMKRSDMRGADLRGANLKGADLRCANMIGVDLRGADLRDADMEKTDLSNANLSGEDLRYKNCLNHMILEEADLNRTDLRNMDLRGDNLRGAKLRGANLGGADLRGADLRGAGLRGAKLKGADLRGVILKGADLRGADLRGADLNKADLRDADIRAAGLSRTILPDGHKGDTTSIQKNHLKEMGISGLKID